MRPGAGSALGALAAAGLVLALLVVGSPPDLAGLVAATGGGAVALLAVGLVLGRPALVVAGPVVLLAAGLPAAAVAAVGPGPIVVAVAAWTCVDRAASSLASRSVRPAEREVALGRIRDQAALVVATAGVGALVLVAAGAAPVGSTGRAGAALVAGVLFVVLGAGAGSARRHRI